METAFAARKVFAERGLDTTLDDVARQAELGVGTVYRRFASKGDLAEARFEQAVNDIVALAEVSELRDLGRGPTHEEIAKTMHTDKLRKV